MIEVNPKFVLKIACMHGQKEYQCLHASVLIVILCLFCNLANYQGLHSWQHSPTQPGYICFVQGQ